MIDGIGPMQFVLVLAVVLLLFGNRIPEVMRSLGSGVKEFKKGIDGSESERSDSSSPRSDSGESAP
jgi:sec-independent protein translocase protein TatA